MHYDRFKNRVYFTGVVNGVIIFKRWLAEILRFAPGGEFSTTADPLYRNYAPHPAYIHAGCYNIFVYRDIVDYQLVGDSYVPLLRCINVADEPRCISTLTFDKPHYSSLFKNVIDNIEIYGFMFCRQRGVYRQPCKKSI